jgi:hypothetical protein
VQLIKWKRGCNIYLQAFSVFDDVGCGEGGIRTHPNFLLYFDI